MHVDLAATGAHGVAQLHPLVRPLAARIPPAGLAREAGALRLRSLSAWLINTGWNTTNNPLPNSGKGWGWVAQSALHRHRHIVRAEELSPTLAGPVEPTPSSPP